MAASRALLPLSFLLGSALALVACGEQQRPFHFSVPKGTDIDNSLDRVARALADNGHPPLTVERHTGLITTKWEDTGKTDGLLSDKPATLVKRFQVTVEKSPAGADVTVRMELKRCAAGYKIDDTELTGTCEAAGALPDPEQREVDVLGQTLEQGLAKGQ